MIQLGTVAFNKPLLIAEQQRLLDDHLTDDFALTVFDASTIPGGVADAMEPVNDYVPLTTNQHDEALNIAAEWLLGQGDPYIGFLDHDIFPTQPTTLIDKIQEAGFYGVGQRHAPTGHLYLWPGFAFFSREWLGNRTLDFRGIRDADPANNGDTGSGLWPLFVDEDWSKLYRVEHGYQAIREPDSYGLQSWGVERIGDWFHASNGSHWMDVPRPEERDELIFELLRNL